MLRLLHHSAWQRQAFTLRPLALLGPWEPPALTPVSTSSPPLVWPPQPPSKPSSLAPSLPSPSLLSPRLPSPSLPSPSLLSPSLAPSSWAPSLPSPSLPSPRWLSTSTSVWSSGGAGDPRKPTTGDGQPPGPARPPPTPVQGGPGPPEGEPEVDPLLDPSMGLVQRFKRTLKQYGKVLIPVHLLTSAVWCGSFYYAAMKGMNVVPFLEYIPGFPERIIKLLQNSQSGYALTAYAMYKIATPARYAVTLGGTSLSVKYLRRHGYIYTPPPVKEYLQDKMEETRDRISEKMEETKERFTEKMGETKDRFTFRKKE